MVFCNLLLGLSLLRIKQKKSAILDLNYQQKYCIIFIASATKELKLYTIFTKGVERTISIYFYCSLKVWKTVILFCARKKGLLYSEKTAVKIGDYMIDKNR